MPFRPSPYASPANPVIPLEYHLEPQGIPSGGATPNTLHRPYPGGGDHSPQSQGFIPSGQSDHNSDEWILGPWPDSRRTSVANYSVQSHPQPLPSDVGGYQPSYPGMMPPQQQQESRPAQRRAQSSMQPQPQQQTPAPAASAYPYLGGSQNPFNNPYGGATATPGSAWMGNQPLPATNAVPPGGGQMVSPRMGMAAPPGAGYTPSYPDAMGGMGGMAMGGMPGMGGMGMPMNMMSPYQGGQALSPYMGGGAPPAARGGGGGFGGMPGGMGGGGMPGLSYGGMPGPMPGAWGMPGAGGAAPGAGAMVGYGAMVPVAKMGRPKEDDSGQLFNRWDPSSEYGVVLDPLQFTVLKSKVAVNPLLMPVTEDDPKKKSVVWNVLFDTNQAHLSTDRSSRSWNEGRTEPATFPRISSLRLCSPCFPWVIDIQNEHGVTCGDVLDRMHDFFNRLLDKVEWESFPDNFKASVSASYRWNRSTARGAPGGRYYGPAIKRGDILRTYTVWKGLVYDEKYVEEQLGTPPGVTLVVVLESREPPPPAIGPPSPGA